MLLTVAPAARDHTREPVSLEGEVRRNGKECGAHGGRVRPRGQDQI